MSARRGLEGTVIAGRYEILSLLGNGSFAGVWRARDRESGEDVALKILHPGYSADPDFVEDFLAQASSFGRLRAEATVATVRDSGHDLDTGHNFVVMDLLGPSVESLLAQRGAFAPEEVYRVAEDVGSALRSIHAAGLVHGDVKATNVLSVPGGDRFALADFALGLPDSAEGDAPTLDMSRVGNWAYASPERIEGTSRSELRPASDLYSLGVLLFRLATGRYPFESRFPQIVQDHLRTPAPDPRTLRPELPAGLAALILRCLQKAPESRFPDAGALVEAVRATRTVRARPTVFPLPRIWLLGGAGLLAVLAIVTALLLWPRGVTLPIRSMPEGVEFSLYEGEMESRFDALEIGETPADIKGLSPGSYTLVIEEPGYFPKTERVEVRRGMDPVVVVLSEQHAFHVDSDPRGAAATLQALTGDRKLHEGGMTPAQFDELRSGPHELIVRLRGYATSVDTIEIGKEADERFVRLVPGELVALDVISEPAGAAVWVDGARAELPTPCRLPNLAPREYEIAIEREGYVRFESLLVVASLSDEHVQSLSVRLVPESHRIEGTSRGSTRFAEAERRESERESTRLERLREEVRNHIARGEWVEADRSLAALLRETSPNAETSAWGQRIAEGMARSGDGGSADTEAAREGVRAAVARYERALEARDIDAFTRLWVSLQPAEREKFARALGEIREQRVDIQLGSILVNGSKATVEFHEVRRIVPRAGSEIVADRDRAMELRRMGSGEWLIVSLR